MTSSHLDLLDESIGDEYSANGATIDTMGDYIKIGLWFHDSKWDNMQVYRDVYHFYKDGSDICIVYEGYDNDRAHVGIATGSIDKETKHIRLAPQRLYVRGINNDDPDWCLTVGDFKKMRSYELRSFLRDYEFDVSLSVAIDKPYVQQCMHKLLDLEHVQNFVLMYDKENDCKDMDACYDLLSDKSDTKRVYDAAKQLQFFTLCKLTSM